MIAPLMTTTPTIDVLQAARRGAIYADCLTSKSAPERAGSAISPDDAFPRLAAAVAGLDEVDYELHFSRDDQLRTLVRGQATIRLRMPCQRCLLERSLVLQAAIDSVLVLDSGTPDEVLQRQELGLAIQDHEVVLIQASELSVTQLLEDDLLLALPQQVCEEPKCKNSPPLSYPAQTGRDGTGSRSADGVLAAAQEEDNDTAEVPTKASPFDILKQLKDGTRQDGSSKK